MADIAAIAARAAALGPSAHPGDPRLVLIVQDPLTGSPLNLADLPSEMRDRMAARMEAFRLASADRAALVEEVKRLCTSNAALLAMTAKLTETCHDVIEWFGECEELYGHENIEEQLDMVIAEAEELVAKVRTP